MTIKVSELKELCNIILNRAEIMGINEVNLESDNYWLISSDDRENFSTEIPNLCVGSLFDDVEELKKVLIKINMPTLVDFDRIANVIIALGERISKSDMVY